MASPAPTLRALWDEVRARWPGRTRFDGIMGDQAHQARKSDHNDGNAIDIGIIPERDPLGDQIAEMLLRDQRCKYVIWNRQIWTPDRGPRDRSEASRAGHRQGDTPGGRARPLRLGGTRRHCPG